MESNQERCATLSRILNEIEETQYGSASTHAAPIRMLMWMQELHVLPSAVSTLDDNCSKYLACYLIQSKWA